MYNTAKVYYLKHNGNYLKFPFIAECSQRLVKYTILNLVLITKPSEVGIIINSLLRKK